MTKVLEWVRGNWVIVACGVVILLTLVLAPLFSGSLEEGVRQTAE